MACKRHARAALQQPIEHTVVWYGVLVWSRFLLFTFRGLLPRLSPRHPSVHSETPDPVIGHPDWQSKSLQRRATKAQASPRTPLRYSPVKWNPKSVATCFVDNQCPRAQLPVVQSNRSAVCCCCGALFGSSWSSMVGTSSELYMQVGGPSSELCLRAGG